MKRLLSIFVAMLMVTTMLVPSVGVFAEETETAFDPFAGDYVPAEKPANLFQNPTNALIVASNTPQTLTRASCSDYTSYYLQINEDYVASGTNYNKGLIGTQLLANNAANVSFPEKLTAGKAYVYSFDAMNYGTTDSFVYNMALGTNAGWTANYSVEKGAEGFVISDKENWTTVAGTLVMKGTAGDNTATTYLCSGFQNAKAGSAIRVRHSASSHPYLAEEVPYDISFTAKSGNTVIKGIPAQFEAKLLNQIGSTGTLNQDVFTFSVFGADGNAVEGLTVSEDGAVSATDAVADGTYYVRAIAQIDEEITWNKTLEINVADALENTDDYVAGEIPANLITSPKNSSFWYTNPTYTNSTTVQTKNEWTADGFAGYAYKTTGTVTSVTDGYKVAAGSRLLPAQFNDYTATEGEHYVIKFAVRSLTENTGFGVRIGTWNGAYSGTAKDVSQIMDYENGVANVPGDGEWHTIKGTLPALRAADINDSGKIRCIIVGMAAGTPADVTMELNNHYKAIPDDVPYFAKEAAYDINVTGAASAVSAGGTLNLEAEVLNQIETKGALTQSFDWVAVTEDRLSYVDGITFTETNDGANVTVNVADTVAAGGYIIVAQDKTYGMNRQYPITVTAPSYDVTELNVSTTASSASVEAISVNATEDVMVVIAGFNGDKLVKAKKAVLTPADGVATLAELAEDLEITGLTAGNKVRVFVWTADDYTPLTMKAADKAPKTIE